MAGLIRDAASPGILKYPTDDSPDPRGTGDRGDLLWLDAPAMSRMARPMRPHWLLCVTVPFSRSRVPGVADPRRGTGSTRAATRPPPVLPDPRVEQAVRRRPCRSRSRIGDVHRSGAGLRSIRMGTGRVNSGSRVSPADRGRAPAGRSGRRG